MRISSTFVASAFLGLSAASSVHRKHEELHNHRMKVLFERHLSEKSVNTTCGCTTSWSTFNGEPTLIQSAGYKPITTPASTASQTSEHQITHAPQTPASSSQPVHNAPVHPPKPAILAKASYPEAPKPAPPAQKPAAQPKKPYSKSPSTHPINSSGSYWAMTYSPYTPSGGCKPSSDIATDVASIAAKGFSSLRLYSTDCNGLSAVATAAQSHNLNLILGVYISNSGVSAARPQLHEIVTWANGNGHWKGVEMIVVGNEAVFNDFATASDLASFVSEAKSAFQAAGYMGPVTTTETIEILSEHAATLCPVSDIAAANIHPFFNGKITASGAGEFVASQLELLSSICPGKEAYNLETGWPSKGSANGAAVPGSWEQRAAVEGIRKIAGEKSAFFSFVDDEWKEEGEWGVERSWGCSQLF
ncbi:MAG: hypothetical protein Q9166_002588 [cf. Caloplaca sp. 2 TL-2023]